MRLNSLMFSLLVVCLSYGPVLAQAADSDKAATAPATAPASAPASSPAAEITATLAQMEALFAPPDQPLPAAQMMALWTERMEKVIELGQQVEKRQPNNPGLAKVRQIMLIAAGNLASKDGSEAARQRSVEIAERIMASSFAPEQKLNADFYIMRTKLGIDGGSPAQDAEKQIREFIRRYIGTTVTADSLQAAVVLAMGVKQPALANEFMQLLYSKYPSPEVRVFLRETGYFVGKPFTASLTRLDGKTLRLPESLKGRVIVVDFWATWCPPCVESVPAMKKLYDKYHVKGVEFVGVSLDIDKSKVQDFVLSSNTAWMQTFSGKGADDPTASQYGISAIPAIWVIGRDGKVITDSAEVLSPEPTLELAIQEALGELPTTKPAATQPSTAPAASPVKR